MSPKKPYSKPSLSRWGTVTDLTRVLGSAKSDLLGGGPSGSTK
jgi:hypothetical protein